MTISEEIREKVVQAYVGGKGSMPYIADMFGVSVPSVQKWVDIYRKTGTYMTGKVSQGRPRLYTKEDEEAILSLFQEDSSMTRIKASELYWEQTKKSIHTETISRILQNNGWTRKKNQYMPPKKTQKGSKN